MNLLQILRSCLVLKRSVRFIKTGILIEASFIIIIVCAEFSPKALLKIIAMKLIKFYYNIELTEVLSNDS